MMHCLILGGQGFLGSHISDALIEAGETVLLLDQRPNKFRQPNPHAQFILTDWTDIRALEAALEGIDVVIHLISTTLPATSNQNPQADVSGNLIATLNLLELCAARRVRRIVFASSGGTVYGQPQTLPIPETHPTDPLNSHGIVKLTIEKYLHLYHQMYGLEYVVLRPGNPYGEWQDPEGQQGFVAVAMGRLCRQQPVVLFGPGDVVRDYIYVRDVAKAFVQAAQLRDAHHIFNVGSGRGLSLKEMVAKIFEVTGRTTRVEHMASRTIDAPANILDITRIKTELGWSPSTDLNIGLRQTWEWITQHFA